MRVEKTSSRFIKAYQTDHETDLKENYIWRNRRKYIMIYGESNL